MRKVSYLEPVAPEVESVLASERTVVRGPDDIRQRAMSRARIALVAETDRTKAQPWLGFRWKLAAAGALAAASLSAAATYGKRAPVHSLREAERTAPPVKATAPRAPDPQPVVSDALVPFLAIAPPRASAEPERTELKVLRPARAAVAAGDFTVALRATSEHERRFPDGQLAEDREALRFQALAGLHRTDDARRVAGAFRKRFPASVLLIRMEEALRATP